MPKDDEKYPFLTRKMLAFEQGTTLSIRIKSAGNTLAQTLTIRGMTKEGMFALKHTTASDGSGVTQDFRMPDFPIWVTVTLDVTGGGQGTCYVALSMLANGEQIFDLCSGLVYYQKSISYPITSNPDKRPNRGYFTTIQTTDPAAGAQINYTITDATWWKIHAIQFTLVTDATVANRRVHLKITTPDSMPIEFWGNVDQTASQTIIYNFKIGGNCMGGNDGNRAQADLLPDALFSVNTTIQTTITGGVAGDNLSAALIYVEKFPN